MGMTQEENIQKFEQLFSGITRDGADRLLRFIRKSDFYTAPASTKYHNAMRGGLLAHSLNVYELLNQKLHNEQSIWGEVARKSKITDESILIIGLLHDICKTRFYNEETKNQKVYDKEVVEAAAPRDRKSDQKGEYVWEVVPFYVIEDQLPYGHGEKSVVMLEQYIKLRWVERFAIRWHMGFSSSQEEKITLANALQMYPVILAVMEADMEATYLLEKLPNK